MNYQNLSAVLALTFLVVGLLSHKKASEYVIVLLSVLFIGGLSAATFYVVWKTVRSEQYHKIAILILANIAMFFSNRTIFKYKFTSSKITYNCLLVSFVFFLFYFL